MAARAPVKVHRPKEDERLDEVMPGATGVTWREHQESLRFPDGHRFAGELRGSVMKDPVKLKWFEDEASRMAVQMELNTWIDPNTGTFWEQGRFSKHRIGEQLGFPNSRVRYPVFLEEPGFSHRVQWERIRQEAETKMSAQTVKPLVAVAASAMLMELLNRALNKPGEIKDRELITETRKYVEMLVAWDAGTPQKSHITQTLVLLQQNINGLPPASRAKVKAMLGREMERGMDAIKSIQRTVIDQEQKASA